MKLTLLLFLCTVAFACHPQSRWMCDDPCGIWLCDDPVCQVISKPVCSAKCVCFNENTNISYPTNCETRCAPDQCESDSCPNCETICTTACVQGFQSLCEATECYWYSKADPECPEPQCEQTTVNYSCPHPRCELMSEKPACELPTENSVSGRLSLFR